MKSLKWVFVALILAAGVFAARTASEQETVKATASPVEAAAPLKKGLVADGENPVPGSNVSVTVEPALLKEPAPKQFPVVVQPENFRALDIGQLEERLKSVDQKMEQEKWIERANAHQLNKDEWRELSDLLQEVSALRLALSERRLDEAERLMEGL